LTASGTKPKGEHAIFFRGFSLKGPAILLHLLGFTWNGFYYYDKCLSMGATNSCKILENFSCALQWIMETKYQVACMSHILDDFLFVGPPKSDKLSNPIKDCNSVNLRVLSMFS
jgi:hypothetical protein